MIRRKEHISRLRSSLVKRLSESELRSLCFDLDIDYENIPGASKEDKIRELLIHLERRKRINELITIGSELRPDIKWTAFDKDESNEQRNHSRPNLLTTKILLITLIMFAFILTATLVIPNLASITSSIRELLVNRTEINEYYPTLQTEVREGSCWTRSIIVDRPDAWRCSVDRHIFDPCIFVTALGEPEYEGSIICGAIPDSQISGFTLRLTEPLPNEPYRPSPQSRNIAWIVELADGTTCRFLTGATDSMPEGDRFNFRCLSKSGEHEKWIIGDLRPGYVWTAQVVTLNSDFIITSRDVKKIRTLWR
jgi:hypothetical protein